MAVVNTDGSARIDYTVRRGDTFINKLSFTKNDEPEDFSGSTFKMQIKDSAGTVILELTTGSGISLAIDNTDLIYNQIVLEISAADMADIDGGKYVYDLQQTLPLSIVKTRAVGNFFVVQDITV